MPRGIGWSCSTRERKKSCTGSMPRLKGDITPVEIAVYTDPGLLDGLGEILPLNLTEGVLDAAPRPSTVGASCW